LTFANKRTWGPKPNYPNVLKYKHSDHKQEPFIFIAGPCSVENESQIKWAAEKAKAAGATHLRGGVFRAGTYPGEKFGYVDETLIKIYHSAAKDNGLKNIIEVLDYSPETLEMVEDYSDCFQVGARQMQNYTLLDKLSKFKRQVFLKRNMGATLDEWLGSAEYLLRGEASPVLIERGSSSFVDHVRWDLSISIIPAIREICQIPVIIDASHGTGRRDLVGPMTGAGVMAGANGCLIEFHPQPLDSLSDSDQAINGEAFRRISLAIEKAVVLRDILY